jgi:hypothetical protein
LGDPDRSQLNIFCPRPFGVPHTKNLYGGSKGRGIVAPTGAESVIGPHDYLPATVALVGAIFFTGLAHDFLRDMAILTAPRPTALIQINDRIRAAVNFMMVGGNLGSRPVRINFWAENGAVNQETLIRKGEFGDEKFDKASDRHTGFSCSGRNGADAKQLYSRSVDNQRIDARCRCTPDQSHLGKELCS